MKSKRVMPTPPPRQLTERETAAMWLWGDEYGPSGLSAVDFYAQLSAFKKARLDEFLVLLGKARHRDIKARRPRAFGGTSRSRWNRRQEP